MNIKAGGLEAISRNGEADDILTGLLEETVIGHRPVCIRKDGIELVDDVGGIRGFCDMLRTIYEADPDDEEAADERDVMLNWAEMMGWTGSENFREIKRSFESDVEKWMHQ